MDNSHYGKILNSENELDCAEKKELLKKYLKTPSLPKLQAARTTLVELKTALNRCDPSKKNRQEKIRHILYKNRSE